MEQLTREEFTQKYGDSAASQMSALDKRNSAMKMQKKASAAGDPMATQFGMGITKSVYSTLFGIGQLGRKVQMTLPEKMRGVGDIREGASPLDVGSAPNRMIRDVLEPQSGLEKTGKFVGDVAQFAIPGSQASKAQQGSGMLARALGQGAVAGGVEAAQEGEINKDVAVASFLGAASVPAGDALSAAANKLTTKLPEWLVRPLVKQAKDAKVKGKDVTPYLAKSGRVGSTESIIRQTDDVIDDIALQVDDLLARGAAEGAEFSVDDIAIQVADDMNAGGANISPDEVLDIVDRLSPQARGLLQKKTLSVVEANKLRSSIDKTVGDRGFLRDQLPFNKEVLKNYTNTLREGVKSSDETLRPLFDEYAKNITLKNALIEQAASGSAKNSLGVYDLLTGAGAFGATGDPVTTIGAIGLRRAFEAPQVKTGLAKVFVNSGPVISAIEAASPATRGALIEFVDLLIEQSESR